MQNKIKKQIVNYMGGECVLCGYKKCFAALHCHHINPFEKSFTISEKSIFNQELKDELEKCLLLCAVHHAEAHAGLISPEYLAELKELK
jgi:hypothetical protein